jgi:RNA polymerase sigma-70 factor (ECF subfamily)
MRESNQKPGLTTSLSLLERARRRDPEAWVRLDHLYRPLVLFWCRRARLSGPDADDVSQEVFAAAAAGLERFHRDRPGDTFRGWLYGITRNQILLFHRRNQDRPRAAGGEQLAEVPDPLAGPDDQEQTEVSHLYHRALEQIRGDFEGRTWQAFCRTVLDGRSPASLTAELAMTAPAIRQAKARVLRRLKEEVGDLLD